MDKFTTVTSTAAILRESNIDTDVIFPARFLILTVREGLGAYLFNDRRFSADGQENPHFALNKAPFRNSKILITGENFGCGSSREQAVWALKGYGIRAILATRFGEIFFSNCFKNGILPITLDPDNLARVQAEAETETSVTIDLAAQTISTSEGLSLPFEIDAFRRDALLNGWDEITMILQADEPEISAFEAKQRALMGWLYDVG
jgi:3-isopropylmalate/(R)-2-methylmalate dehydratase small subunit